MSIFPRIGPGRFAANGLLVMGLLAWLWPVGLGGRMPVGGDTTQFSLGLMAELARAIRSGRLPLWNDLWGYGFPGLAESQMGVYYPPHLLLYGLLTLEVAYVASLVGHTLWAGLGAAWAARRFGVSAAGSALAGFAWAASGFFVIHLPHQWGYTTGSWMPWAWGLAWRVVRGDGRRRDPWLLAATLAVQTLPGHFQLAFVTQLGVLAIAASGLVGGRIRGGLTCGLAWLAAAPLAALQLWPTFRLAALAASRRDFEYLSGFAATPLHLVSLVAPGLFRRSPLWRPIVWDPFHTSPEEYLAYVGLVPLFLAVGAIVRGVRRDPGIRVLTGLAVLTLLLALGPYVPGFAWICQLPGFSFFRAPARWSLATGLALAILAGHGFDALRGWTRPGRSLVRFALIALVWPALVVGGFELALAGSDGPGIGPVADGFDRAGRLLPWSGDPSFRQVMTAARRPQSQDIRVQSGLARQGRRDFASPQVTLERERWSIYTRELIPTAALAAGLLVLASLARGPRAFAFGLVALTAADLLLVRRDAPTDFGPIRPLVEQSEVLARLAVGPRGQRSADPMRNLPMVAVSAPISAYRTLDLPAMTALNGLALAPAGSIGRDPSAAASIGRGLTATGSAVRVLDPFETQAAARFGPAPEGWRRDEVIRDPTLAGWLYGADWVAMQDPAAGDFTLWRPVSQPALAWWVPAPNGVAPPGLLDGRGDASLVLAALREAVPLVVNRTTPERVEVRVDRVGPAWIVISQLDHPGWRARWIGYDGANSKEAEIVRAFDGWQAVVVPGPGARFLELEFSGRDAWIGLAISAPAWLCWLIGFVLTSTRTARPRPAAADVSDPAPSTSPEGDLA